MHSPAGGRLTVKKDFESTMPNGLRAHNWEKKNVFARGKETGLIKSSCVWLGLSQLLVFFLENQCIGETL